MQNINYQQIIAILGMSVWFIFPIGMFISLARQDRESLASPDLRSKLETVEHPKIFEHKKMIYNDELYENDIQDEAEVPLMEDDFNHPHAGIGSEHPHHFL